MSKHYEIPAKLAKQAIKEANAQLRKENESGIFADGDANHPKYNNGIDYTTGKPARLFGYDTKQFMAKQY